MGCLSGGGYRGVHDLIAHLLHRVRRQFRRRCPVRGSLLGASPAGAAPASARRGGRNARRDHVASRGLPRHVPARGCGLSRPRALHGLCGEGDAGSHHRLCRSRQARKRGGGFAITSLGDEAGDEAASEKELVQISAALDDLSALDPSLAQIVDLKFFCGFSFAEIAPCAACRSARCSDTGTRRASICIARFATRRSLEPARMRMIRVKVEDATCVKRAKGEKRK